jgi:hypothetical protein
VGVLPRTRRRSVHDSRNLSRAPAASLRDRLRRPLTEPVCRMIRQLSGSGEGPGTGQGVAGLPEAGREMATRTRASRCHQPRDRGNGEQNQPLTATVAATAATTGEQQRPAAAHNSRTIRANWGYVRPEKQTVEDRSRSAVTIARRGWRPGPRGVWAVTPAVSTPHCLRGTRGRIFPAPARGTPHPQVDRRPDFSHSSLTDW